MNLALNRISGEWDDEKLAALRGALEDLERGRTGFCADKTAKHLRESLEGRTVEEIEVKRAPERTCAIPWWDGAETPRPPVEVRRVLPSRRRSPIWARPQSDPPRIAYASRQSSQRQL